MDFGLNGALDSKLDEGELSGVDKEEDLGEGDGGQNELLGISLHSMTSSPTPRTMKIIGKLGKLVLIDLGTTHAFMDQYVARHLKLPAHDEKKPIVSITNGEQVHCQGFCEAIPMVLQNLEF